MIQSGWTFSPILSFGKIGENQEARGGLDAEILILTGLL
jgi:hypothetical protein